MKSTRFFGWSSLILFVLVSIAATSDYWEDIFPFNEGGFIWSAIYFMSTFGVGLLLLSLLVLVVLILIETKKRPKSL